MRPPKEIQVGPYRYRISTEKAEMDALQAEQRCGLAGFHDELQTQITTHPEQTQDSMADTLLHELLHACLIQSGVQDRDREEDYVSGISATLLDTLRRNPDLVKFLTED